MQKIMIRRQNFLQLLSFSRHILSSLRIQCHFNSKFVYGANRNSFYVFFVFLYFFLNVFFMKLFKEEKKFLEREWSADVMYISQDLKIDFVQRLFFLWTWTHIYFGIALLLFTRLLFTLDVVEDIAMVFFVVFIPPLIKSRLFFLHMNVFHIL